MEHNTKLVCFNTDVFLIMTKHSYLLWEECKSNRLTRIGMHFNVWGIQCLKKII